MGSASRARFDAAANNVQLSGKVREFHIILLQRLVFGIAHVDEEGKVYIRQAKNVLDSETFLISSLQTHLLARSRRVSISSS